MTSLGWQPIFRALSVSALFSLGGEMNVHAGDERRELRMFVDRRFDGRFLHGKIDVAGAPVLEQGVPELRADVPLPLECLDIGYGNATLQMARNVLEVFGCLVVDVARKIEVELVRLDFLEADHARVFRDVETLVEDIHDSVDVLRAQAVLRTVLHEAAAGIDHEDALAGLGVLLIDDHDASRDTDAAEKVLGAGR